MLRYWLTNKILLYTLIYQITFRKCYAKAIEPYFIEYNLKLTVDGAHICTSLIAVGEGEFRVDELLNDYFTDQTKLFKKDLTVKIQFVQTDSTSEINVLEKQINLYPDDEENYQDVGLKSPFNFKNIIFRLSCYGYTGYNCQFNVIENENYYTDFDTGDLVCKNLENCGERIKVDEECENKTYCNSHGTCYNNKTDLSKYCVCDENYAGEFCEFNECSFEEDDYYFGVTLNINNQGIMIFFVQKLHAKGHNPAKMVVFITIEPFLGECEQYGTFQFCKCNRTKYTGKNCEIECSEDCTLGSNCTEDEDGAYCYPSLEYLKQKYGISSPLICKINKAKSR
ncbi:hypothetical protein HZS_5440 [Henneguya salminicola]|nr:hypothetical protein HZS_5440 [Henneguya salminicola]